MTTSGPDERAAELLRLAALVTDGLLEFDEYQAMEAELLGAGEPSAVVDGEADDDGGLDGGPGGPAG